MLDDFSTEVRKWGLSMQEPAPDNDTSTAEASQPSQLVNACHGKLVKVDPLGTWGIKIYKDHKSARIVDQGDSVSGSAMTIRDRNKSNLDGDADGPGYVLIVASWIWMGTTCAPGSM